jgi:fatty acid desaturase
MRDVLLTAALACLLVLLVNPMHFWMPSSMHMLVLLLFVGVVCTFLVFLVKEHGGDERDEVNRASAGRFAFLMGAAVLIAGIIYQGLTGNIDPWLSGALLAMISGKMLSHYLRQDES